MAMTPTDINLTDKISVIRGKFNALLNDLSNLTTDASNITIDLNVTINGNTVLNGAVSANSPDITLNANEAGAGITAGKSDIIVERGTSPNAVIRFDETDDSWKISAGGSFEAITTATHNHDTRYLPKNNPTLTTNLRTGNFMITNDGTNNGMKVLSSGDVELNHNVVMKTGVSETTPAIELFQDYTDATHYEKLSMEFLTGGIFSLTPTAENGTKPVIGFSHTGTVKMVNISVEMADDASIDLPVVTTSAFGWLIVGEDVVRSLFALKPDGTVTLISNNGTIVKQADTDGNFCLGVSAPPQLRVTMKNRLGSAQTVNLVMWYL